MKTKSFLAILFILLTPVLSFATDPHSYAEPERILIQHLDLDLKVDTETRSLSGTATLTLDRKDASATLVLDSQDLKIHSIQAKDKKKWTDVTYTLGKADPILGQKLEINLPTDASVKTVRITYEASHEAQGLQWNTAEQTISKRPFMLSNNEPIAARSWIPCQDTPVVRMSYSAKIHVVQPDLMAVMGSANNPTKTNTKGNYSFNMEIPVPSYLVALAVGKLEFISTGKRTGVYAEPGIVKEAAAEFSDTEKMLAAAESLYGKYAWGRYDLLVLPASYPWGGMENPRLTFVTPSLITGKKDLVDVVAHEIAHSWSGNLVTNAEWSDVWINEGFTTYVQFRIIEQLHGTPVRMRDMALSNAELTNYLNEKDTKSEDTRLKTDFKGRDPSDAFSDIPYIKGAFLLYAMEEKVGKAKFDEFLKNYFKKHTFQSITTTQVIDEFSTLVGKEFLESWIMQPNLPSTLPAMPSVMVSHVDGLVKSFVTKNTVPAQTDIAKMTSKDTCYFLESLPRKLSSAQLKTLDDAFHFSSTVDPEVMTLWYKLSLPKNYELTMQTAPVFVSKIGRGKFVRPIYEALVSTPKGREIAVATYEKHRNFYSPVTRGQIEKIINGKK